MQLGVLLPISVLYRFRKSADLPKHRLIGNTGMRILQRRCVPAFGVGVIVNRNIAVERIAAKKLRAISQKGYFHYLQCLSILGKSSFQTLPYLCCTIRNRVLL